MAYQLKTVCYQGCPRKILLQNENGPCPLLAAANALLLRGVIALDHVCTRNGVASTEDIVNMLANRALSAGGGAAATTNNNHNNNNDASRVSDSSSSSSSNEYHLHEVLSLLPNLQHGMDVNPKFTAGPTGVEYTNNLAAFDLLGVELVHGWLLDPQDVETVAVVQSKTYNQLIETVIQGSEARETLQKLEERLRDLEMMLEEKNGVGRISSTSDAINISAHGDYQHVVLEKTNESDDINSTNHPAKESVPIMTPTANQQLMHVESNIVTISDKSPPMEITEEALIVSQLQELVDTREKLSELSSQITYSEVANAFLTLSGHQLTYHGLEQLHNHVDEDKLCVFFRNNHFATLTKHNGVLFLLVTDLGYANTPEIVWEKLDNIDGDTEYCNEFFEIPTPRAELKPGLGPMIAPELLLAQRSQAESDYQLALAMSKGDGITVPPRIDDDHQGMDDEESKLIEAAKELSLKTYQQESSESAEFGTQDVCADTSESSAMVYHRQRVTEQAQSEHESEQLARQLQELEYSRQHPASTNPRRQAARSTASTSMTRPAAKRSGPASSTCSIS